MSATGQTVAVQVGDESAVGEARRAARRLARELGLGEVASEQAAIVAAEAGRNALLHGGGGAVLLTPAPGARALDVLGLDRGPGIRDPAGALRDGYSTAGTAGQGLGAMRRLAAEFDLYSEPGKGTAVLARVGEAAGGRPLGGAVCLALAGERESGDAWAVEEGPAGPVVLLADGLGHGQKAAEAAAAAVAALRRHVGLTADGILQAVHAALRPTRGAAVAVAQALEGEGGVRYAGVGNISAAVLGSRHVRKLVSLAGTAGHEARSIRAFDYEWPDGDLLIMHTDGITTRWDLSRYPGLAQRHPALIAGILLRDFARGRDDASAVVVRRVAR